MWRGSPLTRYRSTSDPRLVITNVVAFNGGDLAILRGEILQALRAFGAPRVTVVDSHAASAALLDPAITWVQSPLLRATESRSRPHLVAALAITTVRFLLAAAMRRAGAQRAARIVAGRAAAPALEAYAEADVVVSTGGTMLVGTYRITPRLLELLAVLVLQKPLTLWTQSFSQIDRRTDRLLLRIILKRSRRVLVRGEHSALEVRALTSGRVVPVLTPDPAWALLRDDAPHRLAHPPARLGRLRVGLSVREWSHFREPSGRTAYIEALTTLCADLVSRGQEIVFISTCQGSPDYWLDDSKLAASIVESMAVPSRAAVRVNRRWHDTEELMDELRGLDILIGTRLHACILALCAGTPTIGIAYEDKTFEVFERLGIGHRAISIDEVSAGALNTLLEDTLADSPETRSVLASAVRREHAEAMAAAELMKPPGWLDRTTPN